jgi:hypothetical protein
MNDAEAAANRRLVAASLIENSGLRDELDDQQAGRLLNWGLDRLGRKANQLASMDAEHGYQALDAYGNAIAQAMRAVNKLVGSADMGPERAAELTEALETVRDGPLPEDTRSRIHTLLDERPSLDRVDAFSRLMELLDQIKLPENQ